MHIVLNKRPLVIYARGLLKSKQLDNDLFSCGGKGVAHLAQIFLHID